MNLYVAVLVSAVVVFVNGKPQNTPLSSGFSIDWQNQACWNVTSTVQIIQECQTTLPKELQESVQIALQVLRDIEFQMVELKRKDDTYIYSSNKSTEVSGHSQNSTEIREVHVECEFDVSMPEVANEQPNFSVITNQIEDRQVTQTIEGLEKSNEPDLSQISLKINKDMDISSTPHISESGKARKNKSFVEENNLSEEEIDSEGTTPISLTVRVSEEEPDIQIGERPEQNFLQLVHDFQLLNEENEKHIREINELQLKLAKLEHMREVGRSEFAHVLFRNGWVTEQLEDCKRHYESTEEEMVQEKSLKNECMLNLNRLMNDQREHERLGNRLVERIRRVLSIHEMGSEQFASKDELINIIRLLIDEQDHIDADDRQSPSFDDTKSFNIDEFLPSPPSSLEDTPL